MSESEVGSVDPLRAQALMDARPEARLIDVRSKVEFDYVGHPVGAIHVPWKEFPDWTVNAQFVDQVRAALREHGAAAPERVPLLLLCRSGARSFAAAEALLNSGFEEVYNVEEGFEGDKDEHNHRGTRSGWRYHGLPWEQT